MHVLENPIPYPALRTHNSGGKGLSNPSIGIIHMETRRLLACLCRWGLEDGPKYIPIPFLSFPGSFTNLHLDLKQFGCYMQLLLEKSRAVRMQLYPPQCYDITPVRTMTPLEGRQSKLRFDHRMVDNLGNNMYCWMCQSGTECTLDGWRTRCGWLSQRAGGCRGIDYASTPFKKESFSYEFPPRAPL